MKRSVAWSLAIRSIAGSTLVIWFQRTKFHPLQSEMTFGLIQHTYRLVLPSLASTSSSVKLQSWLEGNTWCGQWQCPLSSDSGTDFCIWLIHLGFCTHRHKHLPYLPSKKLSLLPLLTTISLMQFLNSSVSVGKVAHHDEVHICRGKRSLGPLLWLLQPWRRAGHVSGEDVLPESQILGIHNSVSHGLHLP